MRIRCPTGAIMVITTKIVKELYNTILENCKSITIIETICTDRNLPPPSVIIYPGEKIIESLKYNNLTRAEVIAISQTGYTNENITLS